jgi:hypothetical protein
VIKVLKIIGISYLIKTLIIGTAWFFVPDLPARTLALARSAWAQIVAADSTCSTRLPNPSCRPAAR